MCAKTAPPITNSPPSLDAAELAFLQLPSPAQAHRRLVFLTILCGTMSSHGHFTEHV